VVNRRSSLFFLFSLFSSFHSPPSKERRDEEELRLRSSTLLVLFLRK